MYNLTGTGRVLEDRNEDDFESSTRSVSSKLTQEWLEEAKQMVASSPSRVCDWPFRLVVSPRFATTQGSLSTSSLDKRDYRSARRFFLLEADCNTLQSTEVEAIKWTGSGDGIVSGGINVVLWRKKEISWEIAWKFKPKVPQVLVYAAWSSTRPSATAPWSKLQVGDSSSPINEASKCVLVFQEVEGIIATGKEARYYSHVDDVQNDNTGKYDAIQSIVLEAPWFKSCKGLCAYISCSALREVDTSKVLSEILKNGDQDDHSQVIKKLYVPRVEDKNNHMRMLNIYRMNDLIANSMDKLEPACVDAEGNELKDGNSRPFPVEFPD
ncbi:5-formyltetrahydrofolate cyclo-ligase [Forsythia ovata]|uniref:5-formyltetrahydrofolate cyclo-ligase n=1 Tax=Forsythia ovata TaxID=205694 RepID=A0ABD1TRZ2_9LAMI